MPTELEIDGDIVSLCGSDALAEILARRGLSKPSQVKSYLDPEAYTPSPAGELLDLSRAVARIRKAQENNEHITVYGDYDVDGVTATAVMMDTLKAIGADADFYIPSRSEGYGLNLKAVSVLASKHRTKLIITCDCGISNFSEINFAKSLGVDTIIVDHHTMPELLPPAAAILHPKQLDEEHPFYHLPGVGVAYMLAQGLLADYSMSGKAEDLLDFVTLGMIADMVPLVQENRYLVQTGMPRLVNSQRAGLKALLAQVAGKEGTDLVGFGIAPRINAVGRMSDANTAVQLMLTQDAAEAAEIAKRLETENVRRQELCEQIFMQADLKVLQQRRPGDRAIAIYDADWHHGVVGIVASRLVEKYHCPVFIGELNTGEGIVKGSARGVSGIDLYEVLKANEQLALKWGGHKMAAGFSVEATKADLFCRGIIDTCNRKLADKPAYPTLDIDVEVMTSEVTLKLAKELTRLAPFGIGNKKPLFVVRGIECSSSRTLGKEGKHNRIMLGGPEDTPLEAVFWNSGNEIPDSGQLIDIAFTPEINNYNGQERLQLVLADWRDNANPEAMLANIVVSPVVATVDTAAAPVVAEPVATAQPISASPASVAPEASPAAVAQEASPVAIAQVAQEAPPVAIAQVAQEAPPVAPVTPTAVIEPLAEDSPAFGQTTAADAAAAAGTPPSGHVDPPSAAPLPPVDVKAKGPERLKSRQLKWKDLRGHASSTALIDAAVRKLGDSFALFGEGIKLAGHTLSDRTEVGQKQHLLIWQVPPSKDIFKALLDSSGAGNVYLIGAGAAASESASAFLKRLIAVLRFAVHQRDGQAPADKLTAALGTTKMCLALGLTILKKVELIDWFAEDGVIFIDLVGTPNAGPEQTPEFRQLTNCLSEIDQFRKWCMEASLDEIQLALVPNALAVREAGGNAQDIARDTAQDILDEQDPAERYLSEAENYTETGIENHDGKNQLATHQSG